MIDDPDFAKSTLKLLAYQALKGYPLDSLHGLLDDPDYVVRSAVARELQIRGEESTFDFLMKVARVDRRSFVREVCAFTLGQLGVPLYPFREQSLVVLGGFAKDVSAKVRSAAVLGLGHLGADEYAGTIIGLATDSSAAVRASVAAALGCLGVTENTLIALRRLLLDEDENVREWAKTSIEILLPATVED